MLFRQVLTQTAIEMHINPVGEEEKSLGLQHVGIFIPCFIQPRSSSRTELKRSHGI